jgi:hypothetical protein
MMQVQNIVRKQASCDGIMRGALLLGLTIIMFIALLGLVSTSALAHGHNRYGKRACSKTASSAYLACQYEVKDDYWIAKGNCYNETVDQADCFDEAKDEYKETKGECRDQLEARKDLCEELGEDPYDPQLDPVDFVDPATIGGSTTPNRYFPLVPGYEWVYEGETEDGTETITVTVTGDIKVIEYPADSGNYFHCAVVHDVVALEGDVIEDTFDWYAQKINGDVWYFGEISQEFEDGELIGTEGSWKSGVEGAKPGIIMYANPNPDDEDKNPYRQEFFLGDAEDVGEVKELLEDPVVPGIGPFASGVVTEDTTPLEPDVSEDKFYAEGLGLYQEVDNETGDIVELIGCNVDPRCPPLPIPTP